jgi:hypothetical protein
MLSRHHHDDDPLQYRFGLFPEPLTASRTSGGTDASANRQCAFKDRHQPPLALLREVMLAGQAT